MKQEFSFVRRAFFFSFGAVLYALVGILPQLSRSSATMDTPRSGAYNITGRTPDALPFDNTVCVGLAELGKWIISMGLLTHWGSNIGAIAEHWTAFTRVFLYFSVPGLLYSIANNLDLLLALYMDAATFQVFIQGKIVSTSVLWWLVFQKSLLPRQWAAIIILALGSAVCSVQKAEEGKMGMNDPLKGIPLGIMAITSSAMAAISTEWIYKTDTGASPASPGAASFHVQNCAMYTWGIIINWGAYFSRRRAIEELHPFEGFNLYAWLVVVNYVFLGLSISVVMKHFTNITKLFINGASMYVSTCASYLLFHLVPSSAFTQGLCIVTLAMLMYNWELVRAAFSREKIK